MDACDTIDPATLTTPQLLEHRLAIETVARRYMEPDLAIYVVKMAASYTVEQMGVRLRGRKDPSFLTDLTEWPQRQPHVAHEPGTGNAARALLSAIRSCSTW